MPLERSLDAIVEKLSALDQTPHVRALLIEARRLRSIIANWRSIPPLPQVREEMLARVLHISAAAGNVIPSAKPSAPQMRAVQSQMMTATSDAAMAAVHFLDEAPPPRPPRRCRIGSPARSPWCSRPSSCPKRRSMCAR